MPDPPVIQKGATPNDSNPTVVGGTYPSDVDWIEAGRPFARKGAMANRLRTVMNRLGAENFQEQTDAIQGKIRFSGPQLDNAGDITYCMFLAATCVFTLIRENYPKIGIKVTAGNNQFYSNFQDSNGNLLDNNHKKGKAINFEIIGVDNNKSFEELSKKEINQINQVEEVLQAVTAGNKYFQYINEYEKGTRDGDPRNNFLISMCGPCCPAPKEGNIYIEYNSNGDIIVQKADWWPDFVDDNEKSSNKIKAGTQYNPSPANRDGEYDGYIEGVEEKEIAIGLALLNQIEIVDLYDIVESYGDEYIVDKEEIKRTFKECAGKLVVRGPGLPPVRIPPIPFPQSNKIKDKARGKIRRKEKYYIGRTKPRFLKNGRFFSTNKLFRRQSGGADKVSGFGGSRSF